MDTGRKCFRTPYDTNQNLGVTARQIQHFSSTSRCENKVRINTALEDFFQNDNRCLSSIWMPPYNTAKCNFNIWDTQAPSSLSQQPR